MLFYQSQQCRICELDDMLLTCGVGIWWIILLHKLWYHTQHLSITLISSLLLSCIFFYSSLISSIFSLLFSSRIRRTRYGTVVSVVDLTHYLISVTFVSPFQHKSPKTKSGDSNSLGPSSCCVCLYLSVEDFIFVDWCRSRVIVHLICYVIYMSLPFSVFLVFIIIWFGY
jgi:hypothetical protein